LQAAVCLLVSRLGCSMGFLKNSAGLATGVKSNCDKKTGCKNSAQMKNKT